MWTQGLILIEYFVLMALTKYNIFVMAESQPKWREILLLLANGGNFARDVNSPFPLHKISVQFNTSQLKFVDYQQNK